MSGVPAPQEAPRRTAIVSTEYLSALERLFMLQSDYEALYVGTDDPDIVDVERLLNAISDQAAAIKRVRGKNRIRGIWERDGEAIAG